MKPNNRITYRFDKQGRSEATVKADVENLRGKNDKMSADLKDERVGGHSSNNVVQLHPNGQSELFQELNPWHSPFQDDIGALEELIRNTEMDAEYSLPSWPEDDRNAASGHNNKHEEGTRSESRRAKHSDLGIESHVDDDGASHYIELDDEAVEENDQKYSNGNTGLSDKSATYYRRRAAGPSWLNVALSVAGALATGALFGYLLLALFTNGGLNGNAGSNDTTEPAFGSGIVNGEQGQVDSGASTNNNSGATDQSAEPLPAAPGQEQTAYVSLMGLDRTYYFLQYGVFSNANGRDEAVAQLAERGAAVAAMETDQRYRVFAGMAGDRSKALMLAGLLPEVELYVKEVVIQAPEQLPFSVDQVLAQAYFEQSTELIDTLDKLAIAQLEQSSLSSLSKAAAEAWQLQHKRWTETVSSLTGAMSSDDVSKAHLERMSSAISEAAQAMVAYDKKPSRPHLMNTQSALMEAIIAQKVWFETISAL